MIDQAALNELRRLRRELHQYPELSGQEKETAGRVRAYFKPLKPSGMLERMGGEGLAIMYNGREAGPTTMIRCELDGLPVREDNQLPYRSTTKGMSHACGHDGHMAIVAGVGMALAKNNPQ